MSNKVKKSDAEWRESLSPEEYRVLREKGTERPHTGKFNLHFEDGTYVCKGCGQKLFESDSKFDAHCGWPSFDKAIKGTVDYVLDKSHGMIRTEIVCSNCGGHLGHVFNDGPAETGERYCVNSVSIDFKKASE
ncbi:peptide-methionine (R)-S-oxide reductase MsrB [Gaetbulibacter aestuarii]|uniref:peptide-methionine (R)-S-oxide reductase n=1 Tax=Gaetbulibacter aestuarii TaxID=1502358 RepID=A0ABW7MZU3_9FLAO